MLQDTIYHVIANDELGWLYMLKIDGRPYFTMDSVIRCLGYNATSDRRSEMMCFLPSDDIKIIEVEDIISYSTSRVILIDEAGLFCALKEDDTVKAAQFKEWLFSEVLPYIWTTKRHCAVTGKNGKLEEVKLSEEEDATEPL